MGSHRFSSGISSQWAHMNQITLLYRIRIASEISPEWDIPLKWDIPPHMQRPLDIFLNLATVSFISGSASACSAGYLANIQQNQMLGTFTYYVITLLAILDSPLTHVINVIIGHAPLYELYHYLLNSRTPTPVFLII